MAAEVLFRLIAALLRLAGGLLLVGAVAVVLGPPAWSSQQASVWPRPDGPTWPQAGSTVEYELWSSFVVPDGSYRQETTASLRLEYDGSAWTGLCAGTRTETIDGVVTASEWSVPSAGLPALAPVDAKRGDTVEVALLDGAGVAEGCRQRGETVQVVRPGREVLAQELPEAGAYQDVSMRWDRGTGLVLDWSRAGHGGAVGGRLVASDALGSGSR
jgi:hypothetical protein